MNRYESRVFMDQRGIHFFCAVKSFKLNIANPFKRPGIGFFIAEDAGLPTHTLLTSLQRGRPVREDLKGSSQEGTNLRLI